MTAAPGPQQPDEVHAYEVVQQPRDLVGNATVYRDGGPWLRDIEWSEADRIVAALSAQPDEVHPLPGTYCLDCGKYRARPAQPVRDTEAK